MLCWFPHYNVNQPYVYTYPLPLVLLYILMACSSIPHLFHFFVKMLLILLLCLFFTRTSIHVTFNCIASNTHITNPRTTETKQITTIAKLSDDILREWILAL